MYYFPTDTRYKHAYKDCNMLTFENEESLLN